MATDGSEDSESLLKHGEVVVEAAPEIAWFTSELESQDDSSVPFSVLNDNSDKEEGKR